MSIDDAIREAGELTSEAIAAVEDYTPLEPSAHLVPVIAQARSAEQTGHSDVRFTLSVYAKAVKRRSKLSGAYLAEFERALAWAALPTSEKALSGTNDRSPVEEGARA